MEIRPVNSGFGGMGPALGPLDGPRRHEFEIFSGIFLAMVIITTGIDGMMAYLP